MVNVGAVVGKGEREERRERERGEGDGGGERGEVRGERDRRVECASGV